MAESYGFGLGTSAVVSSEFIHGLESMAEKRDEILAANQEKQQEKLREAKSKAFDMDLGKLQYDESKIDPMYRGKVQDEYTIATGDMIDAYKNRRSDVDFQSAVAPVIQDFKNKYANAQYSTQGLNNLMNLKNPNHEQFIAQQAYQQAQGNLEQFQKGIALTPNALGTWNYDPKDDKFSVKDIPDFDMDKWANNIGSKLSPDQMQVENVDANGNVTYHNTVKPEKIQQIAGNTAKAEPAGSSSPMWNKFISSHYFDVDETGQQKYIKPVLAADGSTTGYRVDLAAAQPDYEKWIQGTLEPYAKSTTQIKKVEDLGEFEQKEAIKSRFRLAQIAAMSDKAGQRQAYKLEAESAAKEKTRLTGLIKDEQAKGKNILDQRKPDQNLIDEYQKQIDDLTQIENQAIEGSKSQEGIHEVKKNKWDKYAIQ